MLKKCITSAVNLSFQNQLTNSLRYVSTTSFLRREVVDRREMLKSVPAKEEGTVGEKAVDIDSIIQRKENMFPDMDTPNRLFNGTPFKELPIFHIRVSKNNTILALTDFKGNTKLIRSCGIEGFKNAKKGTNIAAQTTAITVGTKALESGVKTVRVTVSGLGPGRMVISSIKGLQMSGLNIVSITDATRVSWNPPRPRKQRKL